jgi:HlyD family secretion protein
MTKKTQVSNTPTRRSFVRRMLSWVWRKKWWIIIIAIVVIGTSMIFGGAKKAEKSGYSTVEITRGDMRQIVSATGEIQPVNTVNVGSQVSGTIDNIYVDYNSKVKKGDLLLTIEPSVLEAQVREAEASLTSAQSRARLAKSEYERAKILYESDYIARAEMEQAQASYEQAEQDVVRMKSQYERAKMKCLKLIQT